jgi:transposase-like protein
MRRRLSLEAQVGKLIRGTRDAKGVTTIRSGAGGYDKIRCPSCGALAVRGLNSKGKPVFKCQGTCGTEFTAKRM